MGSVSWVEGDAETEGSGDMIAIRLIAMDRRVLNGVRVMIVAIVGWCG